MHQEGGHRGVGEGAEPAPVGVGDEGAEERRDVAGAGEDVAQGGGRHLPHAVLLHQVHHEVGRQAVGRHPLERLVPWRHGRLISCTRKEKEGRKKTSGLGTIILGSLILAMSSTDLTVRQLRSSRCELAEIESPLELVVTKSPLESVGTKNPLELIMTENSLELIRTETPLELVGTKNSLELVKTESPLELVGNEILLKLVGTKSSLELVETKNLLQLAKHYCSGYGLVEHYHSIFGLAKYYR
ncbi:hypothetical protein GW17_00057441 [Ensete ventricosum]|nr:hypothetical protein GW17_00057441 [Ensete ventricosum]